MVPLGFASGLPLLLSKGTLESWLANSQVDTSTIGLFALVALPYTLKFLWAPLMDRYVPGSFLGNRLGHRRSWMLVTQLLLMTLILFMAQLDPAHDLEKLALIALLIATSSASQDIAFDAYRADILKEKERGLGVAASIGGYRVAMLAAGAGALIMSDHIGWRSTLMILAGLQGMGVLATLSSPRIKNPAPKPRALGNAFKEPVQDILQRRGILWILLLIFTYKMGDAFAGALTNTFLLKKEGGLGFSNTDVGLISKTVGLGSVLFGMTAGGLLLQRIGLYRSLLFFGLLQAGTNLGFCVLAYVGRDPWVMGGTIALENFAGGMGTAAFVSLLIGLCNPRFSATQFALFTAVMALSPIVIGPSTGFLQEAVGWQSFFLISAAAAIPGLVILLILGPKLNQMTRATDAQAQDDISQA